MADAQEANKPKPARGRKRTRRGIGRTDNAAMSGTASIFDAEKLGSEEEQRAAEAAAQSPAKGPPSEWAAAGADGGGGGATKPAGEGGGGGVQVKKSKGGMCVIL